VLSKKENRNTKNIAYALLVRPILEYAAASWDPSRGQINALHRVQKHTALFATHTNDSEWETFAQRGTIATLCAVCNGTLGKGRGKL
jgi:hypothetical protein